MAHNKVTLETLTAALEKLADAYTAIGPSLAIIEAATTTTDKASDLFIALENFQFDMESGSSSGSLAYSAREIAKMVREG